MKFLVISLVIFVIVAEFESAQARRLRLRKLGKVGRKLGSSLGGQLGSQAGGRLGGRVGSRLGGRLGSLLAVQSNGPPPEWNSDSSDSSKSSDCFDCLDCSKRSDNSKSSQSNFNSSPQPDCETEQTTKNDELLGVNNSHWNKHS